MYANLSQEDAGAIVDKLKNQKIPYEISNGGRTIRVASDMIHETRLQLAGEGLPEGSETGLEMFEETPLGMTDFIQKLNFQRALQGELTRTIKTLDAVAQVRVHLVIPKDNLFRKEKPKGKALPFGFSFRKRLSLGITRCTRTWATASRVLIVRVNSP